MNIRALVVEKSDRLGDSWRNRYSILTLHTPPRATECEHSMLFVQIDMTEIFHLSRMLVLYQPYPSNWPYYIPKDKYADWIEKYAELQDLVVWTSSYPEPKPTYDETKKRWNIVINRAGKQVELHPSHLIMATGLYIEKYMPTVSGLDTFKGEYIHGSEYKDGRFYSGKHVVVIGTGNTGVDICQDLYHRNAASVTVLQRSANGLLSLPTATDMYNKNFKDGVPNEICDFKAAGIPFGLLRIIMKATLPAFKEADKEVLDGYARGGFEVTDGPDGSGPLFMAFDRGGGEQIIVSNLYLNYFFFP